jgi:nucleoid-associated protein YgaU
MSGLFKRYLLTGTFLVLLLGSVSAQDNEMGQEEYELTYDNYAVAAIKLMVKYGEINDDVEKLKQILASKDEQIEKKQEELYALVGATPNSVNDFRRKFEETEKRINNKTGTPSDARSMYYDEIFSSKIKCLPEFAERFQSMRHRMEDWEGTKTITPIITQETPPPVEGTYLVVKGDCLWKISAMKYNSPYYWPAIWEANKNGVVNKDELLDFRHQAVTNPNLIYPGQVLKIPSLNTDPVSKGDEFKEKLKKFRKERLIKK